MAHIETEIPKDISFGSSDEINLFADFAITDALTRYVNLRAPEHLTRLNLRYGIRSFADYILVRGFYHAVDGPANSFNARNPLDWNTTTSKILKPRNQKIWGYEFGSNVGGRLPIGASLTDSFGNDYKLTSITPKFLGNESGGIRPDQMVTFEVRFGDVPLKNAKLVRLVVEPATFGQQARAVFEIPPEAFYGPVTKR